MLSSVQRNLRRIRRRCVFTRSRASVSAPPYPQTSRTNSRRSTTRSALRAKYWSKRNWIGGNRIRFAAKITSLRAESIVSLASRLKRALQSCDKQMDAAQGIFVARRDVFGIGSSMPERRRYDDRQPFAFFQQGQDPVRLLPQKAVLDDQRIRRFLLQRVSRASPVIGRPYRGPSRLQPIENPLNPKGLGVDNKDSHGTTPSLTHQNLQRASLTDDMITTKAKSANHPRLAP